MIVMSAAKVLYLFIIRLARRKSRGKVAGERYSTQGVLLERGMRCLRCYFCSRSSTRRRGKWINGSWELCGCAGPAVMTFYRHTDSLSLFDAPAIKSASLLYCLSLWDIYVYMYPIIIYKKREENVKRLIYIQGGKVFSCVYAPFWMR